VTFSNLLLLFQAKAALKAYFKTLLEKKKGEVNHQSDILGVLLAAKEDPASREEVKDLDDDTIADNLVLMWFGSFDTTSTTLTWLLKLLNEYPECAKKVQVRTAYVTLRLISRYCCRISHAG
jgi:cytochrome P450